MSVAMGCKHFLWVCATLGVLAAIAAQSTKSRQLKIPVTRFTCHNRAAGYYADMETGCQVYHMCDGLGRQFSYTCPNTTLFQQRMLICDHWYMVNCSRSESDYGANLLIGQRDKPFVSDEEMRFRTPRPDILSVPANSNYFDGLKEAESKFYHPGNSIAGVADSISSSNNNGLDSGKNTYRPPTNWSTGTGKKDSQTSSSHDSQRHDLDDIATNDNVAGSASQRPNPTFQTTIRDFQASGISVTPPSKEFRPPPPPSTEANSEEFSLDVRMKDDDPVVTFIKRFDPNSPDSHKTAMTKTEIISLNEHLPAGQTSAEEERTPRKNKNVGNGGNNFNRVQSDKKSSLDQTRFDSVNNKPQTDSNRNTNQIPTPGRELVPPKTDFSSQPSTTMGPPIYYEWKWAAPAFDLEPPKVSNTTAPTTNSPPNQGKNPFRDVRQPTPADIEPTPPPKNTEYNISSYFVPDYVFPLDKPHPGYEDEDAQTSFQVGVGRPGRSSYGENPKCPHCHPAYLNPGSCEPCIVKR